MDKQLELPELQVLEALFTKELLFFSHRSP